MSIRKEVERRKDRILTAMIIAAIAVPLAAICGMVYIAAHFLMKFW